MLLGGRSGVAATVVFVLGLVGLVAALVLTIDAPLRGPATAESRLDVLARTVGPFLAVYAVWGLVEDELSELFVINIALQGLGGYRPDRRPPPDGTLPARRPARSRRPAPRSRRR